MTRRKTAPDRVTPANCWQVFSETAQDDVRRWREGGLIRGYRKTERDIARYLLTTSAFNYEQRIAGFVADGKEDARRYVGRFWYRGQPDV